MDMYAVEESFKEFRKYTNIKINKKNVTEMWNILEVFTLNKKVINCLNQNSKELSLSHKLRYKHNIAKYDLC